MKKWLTLISVPALFAALILGLWLPRADVEGVEGESGAAEYVQTALPGIDPDPAIPSGRPSATGHVRFAVVGDTKGTNYRTGQIAELLAAEADQDGLDAVLTVGDNLSELNEGGLIREFLRPFGPLLDRGVPFYASLGNHDFAGGDASFNLSVSEFHLDGRRFHSVSLSASVEVFVLDSTTIKEPGIGDEQIAWLTAALARSQAPIKIVAMHHPIYGFSGGREPSEARRDVLESLFIEHGVQLVFQGHQHVYERLTPQNGVHYFIAGAGGGVSQNTVEEVYPIIDGDDSHVSAMIWEIQGHIARFRTITSDGDVIDEGVIEL